MAMAGGVQLGGAGMPVPAGFLSESLERWQLERQAALRSGVCRADSQSNQARHEVGCCNCSGEGMRPGMQDESRCDWLLRGHVWRWGAHGFDRLLVEV